jgi:hypothetical protein
MKKITKTRRRKIIEERWDRCETSGTSMFPFIGNLATPVAN